MAGKVKQRRTQEERKAESEDKIIRAAIRIYAQKGFMRSSLNEIGKEAGYTGGLVSHKFGSKMGLLHAVMEFMAGRFLEDLMAATAEQEAVTDRLLSSIDIYIRNLARGGGTLRALYAIMGESLGGEPELAKSLASFNKRYKRQLSSLLREGVASGEFKSDLDPDNAALTIIGTLRGVAMIYLCDQKAFKIEKMITLLQQTILKSLT